MPALYTGIIHGTGTIGNKVSVYISSGTKRFRRHYREQWYYSTGTMGRPPLYMPIFVVVPLLLPGRTFCGPPAQTTSRRCGLGERDACLVGDIPTRSFPAL